MSEAKRIATSSRLRPPRAPSDPPASGAPAPPRPTPPGPPPVWPGLVPLAALSFVLLWLAAGAVVTLPAAALGWVSLTALHLALLSVAATATLVPGLDRRAALAVAGGAAACIPTLALAADAAGVAVVSTETALLLAATSLVAAGLGFLGRVAQGEPAPIVTTVEAAPEAAPEAAAPRRAGAGQYALQRRIGVGGMGEVWLAEHDTLARPAALKLVRRERLMNAEHEAEALERFAQEARVTARLTSPHTVELYDFGVAEDGQVYYAMELLEGLTVRALVERHGALPEARAAFLLRQACHSLVEAHDAGLVHRDLKPENLFVARRGRDADFLKVLDFGLVKELALPGGRRHLTVAGATPGTPGFMAPEQILAAATVDQRADVYALACCAFYMVAGTPVFEGSADAQLRFAHTEVAPETLSARAGRAVHAGFEALVMAALAKDPAARPTMEALDDGLAALDFQPPWSQARARAWWATARRDDKKTRSLRVDARRPTDGG
ncbi:MAG: serine/threonine protein kinase [Deltaproteobacteria bacterium]|nr:serine/threonine protein kinase [Deltaproteobacteria bacterium]